MRFLLMSCYMLASQNYLFKTFFTLQSTKSLAKLEILHSPLSIVDSDKFVNSLSSRYTGIIWYVVHFGVGFVHNC